MSGPVPGRRITVLTTHDCVDVECNQWHADQLQHLVTYTAFEICTEDPYGNAIATEMLQRMLHLLHGHVTVGPPSRYKQIDKCTSPEATTLLARRFT